MAAEYLLTERSWLPRSDQGSAPVQAMVGGGRVIQVGGVAVLGLDQRRWGWISG